MALCTVWWINTFAGLAVTEQAVRVREIRAKGNVPGLVVEFGLDRADRAALRKLTPVRQHEFDFPCRLIPIAAGHVFEVAGLGHVEIDPHHAVVGQGREDVPLFDQATQLFVQAVDDAVEWARTMVKFTSAAASFALALALSSLACCKATS